MFTFTEPTWVIRKIPVTTKKIFLTFDDGPNTELTLKVLKLLKQHQAKATFFVIGHKAEKNKGIIGMMKADGHSVLSHSVDHDYSNYFKPKENIQAWVAHSIAHLSGLTDAEVFAFRPPAGILNPPLLKAAKDLKVPLLLWNHRLYDSVFAVTKIKIEKLIKNIKSGDIILLHDEQKAKNQLVFLESLNNLLETLNQQGYKIASLSDERDYLKSCFP